MALDRDDLTSDKGNIGYGTMLSETAPPGSAGDPAAEAATAGIVNTDASAELAKQVPDIVVPLNPEVRGDDQFITNEGSDSDSNSDPYTYRGEFNSDDEATIYANDPKDPTGIAKLDVSNIINKNRAISFALSKVNPILGLAYTAYNYFKGKADDKRQAVVDAAETARLDDTPDQRMAEEDIAFAETGDYDVYSDTPTGTNTYTGAPTTYSYEGSDEQDEATNYTPDVPQYSAPTYQESPAYSGSDSGDSGGYDSGDGGSYSGSSTDDYGGGEKDGGFIDGTNRRPMFSGGIARLRKNKQNTRIHDRRKRLAMGGITSLHG